MTDADGAGVTVLTVAGSGVGECDVRATFGEAPRLPLAGTSLASAFNEKVQADLLFLGSLIAIHSMDLFSRRPMLVFASQKTL